MYKTIQYLWVFTLYLFTIFTVVSTAEVTGYESFLQLMTEENSLYESLSVFLLLGISFYGFYSLWVDKKRFSKPIGIFILLISLVTFLAGMEEMSWGQHIFHFSSSDYFIANNLQQETNLHNFIDPNLFSSLIYITIYSTLVFLPLLYKTFLKNVSMLRFFDIKMHHILIILFSSSLQLYFYPDFGVYVDMLTQLFALVFFGYVLWKEQSSKALWLHYGLVVGSTLIFMFYHDVFQFENMQYEIREMFVMLAFFLMFIDFIQKEKNQ
jgi:hypothetical protein